MQEEKAGILAQRLLIRKRDLPQRMWSPHMGVYEK